MTYEMVVGLEVHVQLKTRSKLFCPCAVDFGGPPNRRICPVCTGQPGALPVLNQEALRLGLSASLALECNVPEQTKFDRKNYFYPDLPKGYQISQFDQPVGEHGRLLFEMDDGAAHTAGITRVHIEEDAGKALHPSGESFSQVDLNRAGIPLIEIVGEPDLRTPEQAGAYLLALRRALRSAGISDCDMEKGSLRCDANISLRPLGDSQLGTKVEVKNMNSIRNVERALHFEAQRQRSLLEAGQSIVQETRSFRDEQGSTTSMRSKEEADDYRYFPEPDLPPFAISATLIEELARSLPESFRERRNRLQAQHGLPQSVAELLCDEVELADWFEQLITAGMEAKTAANWIQGELLAYLGEHSQSIEELQTQPAQLAELTAMVQKGMVSHQAAKRVFRRMLETGEQARQSCEALDLLQIQDEDQLRQAVQDVFDAEPGIVADYRGGKTSALNALLGRVMRATQGKGNPQRIRELLQQALDT
jgi:aspartyl-tRNA(Asn)/glutamyl-tRNA(Gln) amidotransferase subunit B